MYLPREIRKTMREGIRKQLNNTKFDIKTYRNPNLSQGKKFSIDEINSEIDDIEESLRIMKTEYYFNKLDSFESDLNKLKETIQMTVSSEVS